MGEIKDCRFVLQTNGVWKAILKTCLTIFPLSFPNPRRSPARPVAFPSSSKMHSGDKESGNAHKLRTIQIRLYCRSWDFAHLSQCQNERRRIFAFLFGSQVEQHSRGISRCLVSMKGLLRKRLPFTFRKVAKIEISSAKST